MTVRFAIPQRLRAVVDHEVAVPLKDRKALIGSAVLAICTGVPNGRSVLPIQHEITVALHHKAERLEIDIRTLRQYETPRLKDGHAGPKNRLIAVSDF